MGRSLASLLFLSFSLLGSDGGGEGPKGAANGGVFKARRVDPPEREVAVIASEDGYYPGNVVVFGGERVRLFLAASRKGGGCLAMPSKDVSLTARPGEVAEGVVFFDRPGTHPFSCPILGISGRVTVLERGAPVGRPAAE